MTEPVDPLPKPAPGATPAPLDAAALDQVVGGTGAGIVVNGSVIVTASGFDRGASLSFTLGEGKAAGGALP